MKEWNEKIADHALMIPHYGIFSSEDNEDVNCLAQGKYCSVDPGMDFLFKKMLIRYSIQMVRDH